MQIKCIFDEAGNNAPIMRLTKFSDYALRILMYLAARTGQRVTIHEISESYGISRNHLMKIVSALVQQGYVIAVRGNGGGLALARPPEEISVGAVVRQTESDTTLVECADRATNTCIIARTCALKHELFTAHEAFYQHLDSVTLASIAGIPETGTAPAAESVS